MNFWRVVLVCLGMAFSTACQRPDNPDVLELTYASPYSPGHPFSRADVTWIEHIATASNGAIRIRAYWSGSLLSDAESMTEIRHGVSDIGLITPIYARGGAHLLRTQAGFYSGITRIESQTALFRCMMAVDAQFAEELSGLKVLAIQGGNNPGVVMRDHAVRTLSDLKGQRIRAPSEMLPILMTLGADPVEMPMGEVYSALAKGVIDGVIAPADTFSSLHFQEVAKYYTRLNVPRGAYPARAMGLDVWNSLSGPQQSIFEDGVEVWERALASELRAASARGEKAALEAGVEFLPISPTEQTAFDEVYLAQALKSANALSRYHRDGEAAFDVARASIDDNGDVTCKDSRT